MINKFFLKLNGIEGDSSDDSRKGWFDLMSFFQGISQKNPLAEGGNDLSRPHMSPIVVTRSVDKITPLLQKMCMSHEVLAEARLAFSDMVDGKTIYEIRLSEVSIVRVDTKMAPVEGESTMQQLIEETELVAKKMEWIVADQSLLV